MKSIVEKPRVASGASRKAMRANYSPGSADAIRADMERRMEELRKDPDSSPLTAWEREKMKADIRFQLQVERNAQKGTGRSTGAGSYYGQQKRIYAKDEFGMKYAAANETEMYFYEKAVDAKVQAMNAETKALKAASDTKEA